MSSRLFVFMLVSLLAISIVSADGLVTTSIQWDCDEELASCDESNYKSSISCQDRYEHCLYENDIRAGRDCSRNREWCLQADKAIIADTKSCDIDYEQCLLKHAQLTGNFSLDGRSVCDMMTVESRQRRCNLSTPVTASDFWIGAIGLLLVAIAVTICYAGMLVYQSRKRKRYLHGWLQGLIIGIILFLLYHNPIPAIRVIPYIIFKIPIGLTENILSDILASGVIIVIPLVIGLLVSGVMNKDKKTRYACIILLSTITLFMFLSMILFSIFLTGT